LSGLELFETKFLLHWKYLPFFTRTKVVTAEAAARYFPNPKQVGGADHASICKPTSRADLVHQYLYDFLYDSALLPGGRTRAEVAGPAGIGRAPAGDERPAARPDRPAVVPEIFVSFASGDDNALSTDLPGWVTQFQRCLTLQLAKSDGRFGAVKISAADSLRPDRIPRESVFLAVISTRYLADAGCRSQLTAFGRRADEQAERPYGDGRSRIFSVLLEDIPPAAWPVECKGTTESNFHGRAASSASAAPVSPTDETFAERLRMLGLAISRELSALRTEGVRDGAEGTAIAPAKPVVFVADTSDSLKAVRQRLVNELGEREVEVISSVPPPFPASDHEAEVTRCLRSAALSVHLLDEFAGREIQGDPGDTYPAKQARLALEHAPAQFVWVPSSLDKVDDERQREFLDSLARRQRVGERFAFVRQSPTTVSREVLSMLSSLRVIEGRRPRLGALLDTHIKDHLHAFALGQFLVGHNIATYVNPEEDDPGRSMNLLERRLREVNRLVIVFGAAGEKWVRARLANAIQIAITQKFSLAACGIYFAPPHTTKDGRFRGELLPIHEFDASDLAREDGLAPLLATV